MQVSLCRGAKPLGFGHGNSKSRSVVAAWKTVTKLLGRVTACWGLIPRGIFGAVPPFISFLIFLPIFVHFNLQTLLSPLVQIARMINDCSCRSNQQHKYQSKIIKAGKKVPYAIPIHKTLLPTRNPSKPSLHSIPFPFTRSMYVRP
ncbi:hypothetical protein EYC80_003287 [Monilinia laxa]|uniref:Uncharacterized protein n=1 Tax=Monilinia laxa TaxID=61186 RepID=A0A5N6KDK8_MONLA|nr:hypothetical protein EYC80_003287 [Monilinia laxa]